ncbi:hypothetical protein [Nocardia abscessus]|uniref:hypothetical protein n=1 Tax=Nocardia abscessus TaxID=120957 RepID=UPI002457D2C3|nr:hypothetical protein [Nocardia abscessus]
MRSSNSTGRALGVLSGSLPLAVPDESYVELLHHLCGTRVAIDTSDAPLRAVAERLESAAPQLLKPNADELAQLTGLDPAQLHDPAAAAKGPRRS